MCGGCNSLRNYHYLSHQHGRRNSWHVDLMPYRNVYVKDLVNHKSLVKCSYHHTENVSTSKQTKINRQFYNSYHTSCVTSTNKTTTAGTSFDSSLQNSGQIKQCLTKLGLPITEGYTCFVTSCPRNVRRRVKLKELDKLYINMTTGEKQDESNADLFNLYLITLITKQDYNAFLLSPQKHVLYIKCLS